MFVSKLTILKAAFGNGHVWVGVVMLALLAVIFIGLATAFLGMALGEPDQAVAGGARRDGFWEVAPPLALAVAMVLFGLPLLPPLDGLLEQIAPTLGGAW
jgi:formate hydrogenlyase subunit 3/multisubunit Na+/H+ antiporter MnhD subunit